MKLTLKQREQLNRPRPVLFVITVGLLCLPWIGLLAASSQLHRQQQQIDAQAKRFFDQVPQHASNDSAQQFDRLGAQLGFLPNAYYSASVAIDPLAAASYQAIDPVLNQFLQAQTSKVSDLLDPLPIVLQQYLQQQRTDLSAIEQYLLNGPAPQWEMNIERLATTDYPSPGFVNVHNVQKLLLLLALDAHQRNRPREALTALEASWWLNHAIAQRSDLPSQISVSIISAQQGAILRHLSDVPSHWQPRLLVQSQQQPIMKGLRFETWLRYQTSQASWLPAVASEKDTAVSKRLRSALARRFSVQTYFKLVLIDNTQTVHRALNKLTALNVCTTPQISAEKIVANTHTADWNNHIPFSPAITARRWQTTGSRMLSLELSGYVLEVKHLYSQGNKGTDTHAWPDSLPDKPSLTCPGESWRYRKADDGMISLSFSNQLPSPTAIPLSYYFRP